MTNCCEARCCRPGYIYYLQQGRSELGKCETNYIYPWIYVDVELFSSKEIGWCRNVFERWLLNLSTAKFTLVYFVFTFIMSVSITMGRTICMYCMHVNTTMPNIPCAFVNLLGNKLSELNLVICGTLSPMELKFYMLTVVYAGSISARCFIFFPTDGSSCSYQFPL